MTSFLQKNKGCDVRIHKYDSSRLVESVYFELFYNTLIMSHTKTHKRAQNFP